MKREELIEALARAAGYEGYAFYTGAVRRVNGTVRIYPAIWLEPPVLKSSEGRSEGNVTYRTTLHFMALPSKADEQESLWTELEAAALSAARSVAGEASVCEVSVISSSPAEQSLTVHGDVTVTLVCDVTMWYYI